MNRRSALVAMIGCASLLLGACSGAASLPLATSFPSASPVFASSAPTAIPAPSASSSPRQSQRPPCPNPHGGACLGTLAPGTYTSLNFPLPVTYTVPAGWQNFEDLPGNLSFVPPGGDPAGVDAGTSDSVGIAASVAVDSADCAGLPEPGVSRSPSAIMAVLTKRPGLGTTHPTAVSIGRLHGFMIDIKLANGWTKGACTGGPDVPLLVGVAPSNFADTVLPGFAIRMYLLDNAGQTISIEAGGPTGGSHIQQYDEFVRSLRFGTP